MNKFKYIISSIAALCLLIVFFDACKQVSTNEIVADARTTDTTQIAGLIQRGENLQSANIDSLLPIKDELFYIGAANNNNKALLYSGIFYAHYSWMKARHSLAMETAMKALADAEKWKIDEALPEIYSIIANIHKESRNYLAFKAIDLGIKAAKQNRDTAELIATLGNKAMFTHGYYMFNDRPQDDHSSLDLQLSALKIAETSPKYESIRIKFFNNISQTYKERKDYPKALFYGDKAVALAKKYDRPRSLTYSYCWLGEAYYYMGQHQKGLYFLNQAIAISRKIDEPYRRMEINESINNCYTSTGNYKEALAAYKIYIGLKDSLEVIQNSKQLSELQIKYEGGKKDQQIVALNKLNKLNRQYVWMVAISALIFLGLFVLILFQYFIIRKNNKLIKEKIPGLTKLY